MPTINQLPAVTQISGGDQIPLYLPNAGDARRCSLTILAQWLGDNNVDIDASEVVFTQTGTGAVVRTVAEKLYESVSIEDFGAVGNGTTDDTAAIQAALNSGANAVFIPADKTYLFSTLTIPNIINFTFFGDGPASQLKMKSGGSGIVWAGNAGSIYYMQGTLRDFYIDGTNGSNHCINTAGVGGLDLNNIYIKNVPTGYDGIHVDGFNSVQTHDIRINNYRCYSNTAGRAGIGFGPYAADASVSQFIMNGNMVVEYGLWFDSGVSQVNVADSHIYNAGTNIVHSDGASGLFFTHCVIDRSNQNLVELQNGGGHVNFVNCYFEAIESGKIGINIGGSSQFVTISDSRFQGGSATSAVKADNSTNGIRVFGCDASGQSWTKTFDLLGINSSEIGNLGTTPLGVSFGFSGVATSTQAQNTTSYLGLNGGQATEAAAEYMCPYAGYLKTVSIAVTSTPAAGQNFTFTVRKNNTNIGTALVITNGQFSGTIALDLQVAAGDRITISSVYSATSGSSRPRWTAAFVG